MRSYLKCSETQFFQLLEAGLLDAIASQCCPEFPSHKKPIFGLFEGDDIHVALKSASIPIAVITDGRTDCQQNSNLATLRLKLALMRR